MFGDIHLFIKPIDDKPFPVFFCFLGVSDNPIFHFGVLEVKINGGVAVVGGVDFFEGLIKIFKNITGIIL